MQWEDSGLGRVPVKSWCSRIEKGALEQAANGKGVRKGVTGLWTE
jgi:hypothetical protein